MGGRTLRCVRDVCSRVVRENSPLCASTYCTVHAVEVHIHSSPGGPRAALGPVSVARRPSLRTRRFAADTDRRHAVRRQAPAADPRHKRRASNPSPRARRSPTCRSSARVVDQVFSRCRSSSSCRRCFMQCLEHAGHLCSARACLQSAMPRACRGRLRHARAESYSSPCQGTVTSSSYGKRTSSPLMMSWWSRCTYSSGSVDGRGTIQQAGRRRFSVLWGCFAPCAA